MFKYHIHKCKSMWYVQLPLPFKGLTVHILECGNILFSKQMDQRLYNTFYVVIGSSILTYKLARIFPARGSGVLHKMEGNTRSVLQLFHDINSRTNAAT